MNRNLAGQKVTVFAFDATTGLPKPGDAANLTCYVDKDDAGVAVLADTTATEKEATNAKGYYVFDLSQAETDASKLTFTAKSSTANVVVLAVPAVVYTLPATGILSPKTAGGSLLVDNNGFVTPDPAQAIPAAPAAGSVAEAWQVMAVLFGRRNTAQAGGANTITLDLGASAVDNQYRGYWIRILSGTGVGQLATILAYNGTSKLATIGRKGDPSLGWDVNPDATSVFIVIPQPMANVGMWEGVVPLALDSQRVQTRVPAGGMADMPANWPASQISATGVYDTNVVRYAGVLTELNTDPIQADLRSVLGSILSETNPGQLAAAFKKFFDVLTPLMTTSTPVATPAQIADGLLNRSVAGGADGGTRTVGKAFRSAVNKFLLDVPSPGQYTLYDETDTNPIETGVYLRDAQGRLIGFNPTGGG